MSLMTIVPDAVHDQVVVTMSPGETVLALAEKMAAERIGAVAVTEGKALVGIVTERDLAFKVLARGLDPKTTTIDQVMTPDPDIVGPDEPVLVALERMQAGRYRHLPVMDGDDLVAMVSIRDLYATVRIELEQALLEREAFISAAAAE